MTTLAEVLEQVHVAGRTVPLGGGVGQSLGRPPQRPLTGSQAANLSELLSPEAPLGQRFREAARARLTPEHLALPNDDEISAVEQLIGRLGADSRLIAFFASGAVSLASQSVAQFAGWNIPGVGEGDQRFRPRTRLYDTLDPDTIVQVRETIAYERTAFVFIDSPPHEPVAAWADALVPAAADVLGKDVGDRVAYIGDGAASETSLAHARVAGVGGTILRLGASHGLAAAPLLVAPARGMDLRAIRAGAEAAAETLRAGLAGEMGAALLLWPALAGTLSRAHHATLDVVALTDRLSRATAWTQCLWAQSGPRGLHVRGPSQAVSGLTPGQLGLGAMGSAALVDVHRVETPGSEPADTAFAGAAEHLFAAAEAGGCLVRQLVADGYDAGCYGAFAMRAMLEADLARLAADVLAHDDR